VSFSARPLRILVVDDNVDAARTLATLVGLWGHEAHAAYNGPAALAEASEFHADVVLCDLAMPGLDGCKVAEGLRRHAAHSGTLLVAVTAHGDDDNRRRAAYAGFHAHLVKPVEPDGLRRLLEGQAANL
jgi:two-component system CheB/CheR fusion protein